LYAFGQSEIAEERGEVVEEVAPAEETQRHRMDRG
jgi:hypothetical protein